MDPGPMASLDAEQSVHREAALSRMARRFKAGASERSPPLWPGINAALTLQAMLTFSRGKRALAREYRF